MGKRYHNKHLPTVLYMYANDRVLDYHRFDEYHLRLTDGGYTCLDIWTTGSYYIKETDYFAMVGTGKIERAGEKGHIPAWDGDRLRDWLDKMFFPEITSNLIRR